MSEMTVASINERAAEEFFRRGLDSEQQGNHEKAADVYRKLSLHYPAKSAYFAAKIDALKQS